MCWQYVGRRFNYLLQLNNYMDLESSVATARKESKSVRATIPEGIVAYLRLEVGDKLEWVMETQGKERVAIVKKKKV